MKPQKSPTEVWSLTSTQKALNDNNKEQLRVFFEWSCLFVYLLVYHTMIAINFPTSSSHSYSLQTTQI